MKFRFHIAPPRRDDGTLLPAVLVGALFVGIAAQMMFASDAPLLSEGAARIAMPSGTQSIPNDIASPIILARPLFAPARNVDGVAQLAGQAGSGQASPMGGATVAGMVARGRSARAFLRLSDGRILTVPLGGTFAGWRLISVNDGAARFVRGSERISIPFGSSAPMMADAGEEEDTEDDEE